MFGTFLMCLKAALQRVQVSYRWVIGYWVHLSIDCLYAVLKHMSGWSGGALAAENDFYDLVEAVSATVNILATSL
jgi:hypothetical protein